MTRYKKPKYFVEYRQYTQKWAVIRKRDRGSNIILTEHLNKKGAEDRIKELKSMEARRLGAPW